MALFAGVGVSHILIDLVNRLKFNEVSAGITVRKRDELTLGTFYPEYYITFREQYTERLSWQLNSRIVCCSLRTRV
jgi:hypothetical protein